MHRLMLSRNIGDVHRLVARIREETGHGFAAEDVEASMSEETAALPPLFFRCLGDALDLGEAEMDDCGRAYMLRS